MTLQELQTERNRLEQMICAWPVSDLNDVRSRFDQLCDARTEIELEIELLEEYEKPIR